MKQVIHINRIPVIDDEKPFLVLTYYGYEGMKVSHQADTAEEAIKWMNESGIDSPQSLVRLVKFIHVEE